MREKKEKQIVCAACGSSCQRKLSVLLRVHHVFCDRACYHAWQRALAEERVLRTVFREDQYFFTSGGTHEPKK